MFDEKFISQFIKETGISKLTNLVQSLSIKVDDLKNATDLKTYSLNKRRKLQVNWQVLRRACLKNELIHFKIGDKYQVSHACLREYLDKKMNSENPLRKVG